ncbi:MAG: response regulator [Chitinophagaceae bacterium]|nr:response regulator [Oligoflexus sp.]
MSHTPAIATLLVADDEEGNKLILARRLKREGYQIIDACDGEDAVQKIRGPRDEQRPCLVLMDINMPNMNSIEPTRILKNEFKDIPIIAVTACVVDTFDYKDYGFDQLCLKPVDFTELLAKIKDSAIP